MARLIENNLRFPGQYFDAESGLHYNYFRDYDPRTGRYIEPDPVGLNGGMNLSVYAENNPISLADPFGLQVAIPYPGGLLPPFPIPNPSNPPPRIPPPDWDKIKDMFDPTGMPIPGDIPTAIPSYDPTIMDNPPIPLNPPNECKDKDDDKGICEQRYRIETDTCNAITKRRGRGAGERCHASASQRYSECLRFGPAGIRTPLDIWSN